MIGIVAQADLALKDRPERVYKTVAEISRTTRHQLLRLPEEGHAIAALCRETRPPSHQFPIISARSRDTASVLISIRWMPSLPVLVVILRAKTFEVMASET